MWWVDALGWVITIWTVGFLCGMAFAGKRER